MSGDDEVVRDPTGIEVILTERCWTGHIVVHHPEMAPFRHLVAATIARPDRIHLGKRDPARRVYARTYPEVPAVGNWLTLLVFVDNQSRYVATAYLAAEAIRQLGPQLWPTS